MNSGLHCESQGTGPPTVLLHGWGLNLRVFDALARELARTRRVVRIDLPGHGRSAFDAEAASFAAQVDAVLAKVPAGSLVIGWSLGGQFALELARRAPRHVRALALLASTPRFVAAADWLAGMKPLFLNAFATRLRDNWQAVLEEFLALQVRGGRASAEVLAGLHAALATQGMPDPQALAVGLELLRDNDLRPHVHAISVPTLLISGQHDRVTPSGASAWLAQALPAARHVELARAGHAPFLSHALQTTTLLRDFAAELAA